MKRQDVVFLLYLLVLFLPFFVFPPLFRWYETFNREHGIITAFTKFAVLATSGELIGLRIRTGSYFSAGFGLLPRALVWGFLGLTISFAFMVFSEGTPRFMEYMGINTDCPSFACKLMVAFCISVSMNMIYAPVMMTFHKITNTHILRHNGRLDCLVRKIDFPGILSGLDWKTEWNFVFLRTIPLFWIPAHTITFMLPHEFRVLFAAVLGIMLGVILSFANLKKRG